MPLKKLQQKAGVNRENTRYTNENGYYVSDKVRFRQGTPECIGGWQRISSDTFLGICRSLWNWVTLGGQNLLGVGTNLKFYIENGGLYYDVTPLRQVEESPVTLSNPFDTTSGSAVINVNDTAHGLLTGDIATFSGAVAVGGISADLINTNHTVTVVGADDYTITVATTASSTVTGGGGASVSATYRKLSIQLSNPFATVNGSTTVTVTDATGGYTDGDFVTFSGATTVAGLDLNGEYEITITGTSTTQYTITAASAANATTTGGGTSVVAQYQINVGAPYALPLVGWGAGPWGAGPWGVGVESNDQMRIWSQTNFGQDLLFAPNGGEIYVWQAQNLLTTRGVAIATLPGASSVPTVQNFILVSDTSRFTFAFGCNDYGETTQNPMLIRWSDQEDYLEWFPSATNQAGSLTLSHGSKIVTAIQSRQEIVVLTDTSVYSLQYQGPPAVWGSQILGDNISLTGPNAVALATGVVYWMGVDKFYKYDGRVQTLRCDLRQYIYEDINLEQATQIFASTNEGFNEVWFFYCSSGSTTVDRYVIYNYLEDVWAYGTMARTAWLDSGLRNYPMAATYSHNVVYHENGTDDNETGTTLPINAIIETAEFDIDDGDHFGFVWRILPDITFRGSNADSPQVTMTLIPMQNSGSGYNDPISLGGNPDATVVRTATVPIEQFTGQVYVRVRGRQMIMRVESDQIGCTWQLGSPRIDIRQDGRRGNS